MKDEPKKFIRRVLEFAAVFCLAAFLLKLGIRFIMDVWWVLLIGGCCLCAVVGYRIWRSRRF